MRVAVTGATGFIGRHVVQCLLDRGHAVVAVARSADKARAMPWAGQVGVCVHDLGSPPADAFQHFGRPDLVLHLAWQGMPLYNDPIHLERALPDTIAFLKALIDAGLTRLAVIGSCFEYGLINGCLDEAVVPDPVTPYGLAKHTLRKWLEWYLKQRQPAGGVDYTWLRLFFMYGPGQHPRSLVSQLETAIAQGDARFKMSGGEQLRDFLPVAEVARLIVAAACQSRETGIINCCSGQPISVRRLVERIIAERGATLALDLGHYPYPAHEPMAFWGDRRKLDRILAAETATAEA